MAEFAGASGTIHYTDQGQGDALILVHGFAASAQENWGRAGWISMLTRAGRRVIAVDLLGHGLSAKPPDPVAYSIAQLGADIHQLRETLELKKPDLIGFSLGGRIVLDLLLRHGDRYLLGVLCGAGERWMQPQERDPEALPRAFEAETADAVSEGLARNFRLFADAQGQDRLALAALARGFQAAGPMTHWERLADITNEVLVIAGRADELAGDPLALAQRMPRGKSVVVPACGHMDCLTQPMFKAAVMDFLAGEV